MRFLFLFLSLLPAHSAFSAEPRCGQLKVDGKFVSEQNLYQIVALTESIQDKLETVRAKTAEAEKNHQDQASIDQVSSICVKGSELQLFPDLVVSPSGGSPVRNLPVLYVYWVKELYGR